MVPTAVALSFVAGVSPLVDMWTTLVLGFFAALVVGGVVICYLRKMKAPSNDKSLLSRLVEIYQCPITYTVMVNPSIVDGSCHHTVSREPATEWYRQGSLVCPVCNAPVRSAKLSPNVQAREVIEEIQRQLGNDQQASQAPVAQTKRFRNGGVWGNYVGELDANGLRHGKGKLTRDDGRVYEGEWQNDKRHGEGTLTFPDGEKYMGGYQNGVRCGYGITQFPNGQSYEGEWKDGKRDGQGTYKWPDGIVYEGEWQYDERHGQGILTCPDGEKYMGSWENGVRYGYGIVQFPSGQKYMGSWENGVRYGYGIVQFPSGQSYEGEWKGGCMDGQGTFKWPDSDKYVGGYKADKRSGVGTYYFNSGSVEISHRKEDKMSGEGVRWSADRQTAWQLSDGKPGHEIDLTEAMAIASRLGYSEVP